MKLKSLLTPLLILGLSAGVACSTFESGKEKQARLEAKARISRADAEKTVLAKVPGGKILEGELEEEKGKLIWSFDISMPGSKNITEVQVNALTGEVVSVDIETPAQQEKEKKDKEKEGKK